jgi:hypothetical protein
VNGRYFSGFDFRPSFRFFDLISGILNTYPNLHPDNAEITVRANSRWCWAMKGCLLSVFPTCLAMPSNSLPQAFVLKSESGPNQQRLSKQ